MERCGGFDRRQGRLVRRSGLGRQRRPASRPSRRSGGARRTAPSAPPPSRPRGAGSGRTTPRARRRASARARRSRRSRLGSSPRTSTFIGQFPAVSSGSSSIEADAPRPGRSLHQDHGLRLDGIAAVADSRRRTRRARAPRRSGQATAARRMEIVPQPRRPAAARATPRPPAARRPSAAARGRAGAGRARRGRPRRRRDRRSARSSQLLLEQVGEAKRAPRRASSPSRGKAEPIGSLALREPAPVGELDHGPLVGRQVLSAAWTRQASHDASARSSGRPRGTAPRAPPSAAPAAGALHRRSRSAATVYSQAPPWPRSGS